MQEALVVAIHQLINALKLALLLALLVVVNVALASAVMAQPLFVNQAQVMAMEYALVEYAQ
jgi:hypothetical protein